MLYSVFIQLLRCTNNVQLNNKTDNGASSAHFKYNTYDASRNDLYYNLFGDF